MLRVVFVGETNRENGFVWYFRTPLGSEATQKSRNGLRSGGWPSPAHLLTWGRGRGQIICIYLMEGTIRKGKQASSIQSAEYAMNNMPWSQLIRNLRSAIPKTSYHMKTDAKGGKREEKEYRMQLNPLN